MAVYINTLNGGNITIGSGGSPTPPAGHPETIFTFSGGKTVSLNESGSLSPFITDSDMDVILDYDGEKLLRDDLSSVDIGNTVTSIADVAFLGCSSLTSVTIPNSVTNIGMGALANCSVLTNVTFQGKTLEQVQAMDNYSWGIEDTSIINVA